jgi:hypothetical protein
MLRLTPAALLVLLTACAGPQGVVCHGTQDSAAVADVFFGRNIGGKLGVSEAAWRDFVASEVSPRFPDGLTLIDAIGQWRDMQRNAPMREPSKILSLILHDRARDEKRIDAIVDAYKRRFRQQSVAVVIRPACVSFR